MKISMLILCATAIFSSQLTFANESNKTTPVTASVASTAAVIYLNQANVEQLVLLKGIGEKKAQAIINYREINGEFTRMEDLLNVKGIGEKVLADNLPRLKI